MPLLVTISPEHRLVYVKFVAVVSEQEFRPARQSILTDARFKADFDVLVDLRDADITALPTSAIESLAARSVLAPLSRRAIIADTTVKMGLARMYDSYRSLAGGHETTKIFATVPEALAWLGIASLTEDALLSAGSQM